MAEEIEKLSVSLALESGSFSKQMSAINKEIKNTERDFKSAGKGVDGFEKSFSGLDAKIKATSKQIDLYNNKLDKQKEQYDKLSQTVDKQKSKLEEIESELGKGSKQWKQQAELVQKNSEKLNRLGSDINATQGDLDRLGNELNESVRAFEELGNKTKTIDEKLADVGRQSNLAESEFNRLGSELQSTGSYFEKLGNDMNRLSSEINSNEAKLSAYEEEIRSLGTTLDRNRQDHQQLAQEINQIENELSEASGAYGENSQEAQQLSQRLLRLRDDYNSLETEIEENSNALDEYQTDVNNTRTDINNLRRDLSQMPFDRIGNDLVNSGQKIKGVGQNLTSNLTVPLLGAGTAIGIMSYNFDQGLAKVGSLVGKSGEEMKEYEDEVKTVCKNLGIGTEEMTESWYGAVSAGVEFGESIEFVESAGKLAVAGFTDSSAAVDILTTSLNIYGKEAGTADEIANKLLFTQNKGKTTVDELGSAMGQSLSIGGQYGVTFDNIATAFAKATLAGNTTADAGTQIKSMLSELGDSGSKVAKVIEEETGKSFKTLMEEGTSLSDALEIVKEGAEKSGVGIGEMFSSSEAGLGAMALLSEEGINFNDTLKEMGGELDLVDESFKNLKDSAGAQLLDSINNLKLSVIKMGDALAPVIEWLSEKIVELADWFSSLDEEGQKNLVTMAGLAMAIGPVLSVIGTLMMIGGNATIMLGNLGSIMGGLSSFALPAIALAFAGLAIAIGDNSDMLLMLQDKFGGFGTVVGGICEYMSGIWDITFKNLFEIAKLGMDLIAAVIDGPGGATMEDAWKNYNSRVDVLNQEAADKLALTTTKGLSQMRNASDEQLEGTVSSMDTILNSIPSIVDGNYNAAGVALGNQLANMDSSQIAILQGMNDTTRQIFGDIKEGMSVTEATEIVKENLSNMAKNGQINAETMEKDVTKALETMKSNMDTKTKEATVAVDKNTKEAATKADTNTKVIKDKANKNTQDAKSSMDTNTKAGADAVAKNMGKASQSADTELSKVSESAKSNMDASAKTMKESATDMSTVVETSFSDMNTNTTQHSESMAKNAKFHADNMEASVKLSTKTMADAAIADWERVRSTYNKSISGTITVTTVNRTVNETVTKSGGNQGQSTDYRNIDVVDPSRYQFDAGYYSQDSKLSKSIISINRDNNSSSLDKKLDKLIDVLSNSKTIKQENNISITSQEPLSPSQVARKTRKELELLGRRIG